MPRHIAIPCTAMIAVLIAVGCEHRTPRAVIEVIDTSRSITPRSEKAALDAIPFQIAHMQRGDELILIPITGDGANGISGRVLRLTAPIERESYDADLRRFRDQAGRQFAAWASSIDPHQSRTDILSALDAARQQFAMLPTGLNRSLIVASDFIEDDSSYNFVSAGALASPAQARQLAARLREQHGFPLRRVSTCLGRLESSDFSLLSTKRKQAIQVFWSAYLTAGSEPAEIQLDGSGMLADIEHGCLGTNQ